MAQGQKRNRALVPQASQALERLKQEVATELGIQNYQGYLLPFGSVIQIVAKHYILQKRVSL